MRWYGKSALQSRLVTAESPSLQKHAHSFSQAVCRRIWWQLVPQTNGAQLDIRAQVHPLPHVPTKRRGQALIVTPATSNSCLTYTEWYGCVPNATIWKISGAQRTLFFLCKVTLEKENSLWGGPLRVEQVPCK